MEIVTLRRDMLFFVYKLAQNRKWWDNKGKGNYQESVCYYNIYHIEWLRLNSMGNDNYPGQLFLHSHQLLI